MSFLGSFCAGQPAIVDFGNVCMWENETICISDELSFTATNISIFMNSNVTNNNFSSLATNYSVAANGSIITNNNITANNFSSSLAANYSESENGSTGNKSSPIAEIKDLSTNTGALFTIHYSVHGSVGHIALQMSVYCV